MPNFDVINEEIEQLNKEIERAKFETEFVKSGKKKEELKIKPLYIVFLLIVVFFVELATSIMKRRYEPTIWLYCATGGVILIYAVYCAVFFIKKRNWEKSENLQYENKRLTYEILLNKRKDIFEKFVADTNGLIMRAKDTNLLNYIWVENDILTLASLENQVNVSEIKLQDISYISSDKKLFDYNKVLGNATNVNNDSDACYIFTKERCFAFHDMNYDRLVMLMPEKELLNVLTGK